MPASLESPAGTAPSVLLIEEYDALAAALTSALKKFAPRHRTHVVESLSDAESAAAELHPQLFVLDFDPPHRNAIEFFDRMCRAHPEARVLVIASGTSPEFAAKRYGPNAIHFVEKPFELADFGAAVQALLGPWTEAISGDSRGTLRDLNLRDFVPLECVSGATAVLTISAPGDRAGEIHFLGGHICHASAWGLNGIDALHEIMRWRNARGVETERAVEGPCTIHGPWLHVFLEALEAAKPVVDELKIPFPPVPSFEEQKPATTGKKIIVIDDTEMLLIFVEDVLSIADPSLQIVTALTGNEGVRRVQAINPDLVLLDYSLSDLRGDQICEQLLENEVTARIPVVMMSGHVPEMMATAERCPNVVATIAKPFMSEALVHLVNETLAKGSFASAPQRAARAASIEIDRPHSASPEPKPVRHVTEKKPVKKSASLKSGTTDRPEKPTTSVPTRIKPAPILPAPAISLQGTKPFPKVTAPASPPSPTTRDIRPVEQTPIEPPALSPARPAKLGRPRGTVVLGLGMEVISVQFTSRFQISTIRAKPSTTTVSLTHLQMPPVGNHGSAGFELGPVQLDSNARIRTIRVRPTHSPADSIRTRNGFDINDVNLVNETACIQFTARSSAPMIMQLVAIFKVVGVDLSDRFEVAQLVLQPEGNRVRITLDPRSRGRGEFDMVGVRLDASARIAEFILHVCG